MKDVVWIMQKNLVSELHRWEQALWENKSSFRHIEIVPFLDELPDVELPEGAKVICYGSTTLIKNAPSKGWNPGVFFNQDNFRPSIWKEKYGQNFLNWNGYAMKLKDIQPAWEGVFFFRPDGDLKDFSGSLVDYEGVEKFRKSVQEGGFPFDDNLIVFASAAKNIVEEWRCFIVDGKVVSATKYKIRTMIDKKPGAPQEVIDFANKMAQIWSPEKAYVMDICNKSDGSLHVLELNCFNASGVYAAPLLPIIIAIENLLSAL